MGKTINRRPKVKEIAERAGVSRATVDRVINNRQGVQSHTRTHVLSVIGALVGIATYEASEPVSGELPLDFIIPDQGNAFLAELTQQIEKHAQKRGDVSVTIHRPDAAAEHAMVATLEQVAQTTKAVGVIGLDSHKVREAIRSLCSRNIPVVTLASDIRNVPRNAYVGIDNHAAGRLAGYLTGRMLGKSKGKAALVLGSRAYLGHEEREMGFRVVLREHFPALRIVDEREIHENTERAYREVTALLVEHPDLDAIYCIGAGQPGVAQALIDAELGKSVLFVGHGLSADTRQFLVDEVMDVVIDESAHDEASAAIACLVAASRNGGRATAPAIPIHPIFRENLPAEP